MLSVCQTQWLLAFLSQLTLAFSLWTALFKLSYSKCCWFLEYFTQAHLRWFHIHNPALWADKCLREQTQMHYHKSYLLTKCQLNVIWPVKHRQHFILNIEIGRKFHIRASVRPSFLCSRCKNPKLRFRFITTWVWLLYFWPIVVMVHLRAA